MKYIGERIKELRRKNDMTQEKLADYLCVTYQTVSKWETGVTSPDLSLIVPLARLFKVTTDELFDFKETAEEINRAELKKQYDDTFMSGDIDAQLAAAEKAVKAYPGDMKWLNNYAWAVWCNAVSLPDDAVFTLQREKAIELFKKVIENCESDDIKGNAIVGIVQCLNGKGEHDEAKRYAELYPDVKISADEKENLLLSCKTGEERITGIQQRCLKKAESLLQVLITDMRMFSEMTEEAGIAAKQIIKALIPDGNYLTLNYELYMIALSEARADIAENNVDKAVSAMQKAREYAIALDAIKGEYTFTCPLFNNVKYNTNNWYKTGTTTMLEDFRALFEFAAYAPLKKHKDYAELIK